MRTCYNITMSAATLVAASMLTGCGAGGQDDPSVQARSASSESSVSRALRAPVVLDDADKLAAGPNFVSALGNDGEVVAWGYNSYGQLGNGKKGMSLVPVHVDGMSSVKAVRAGQLHTAVLRTDGSVWGWGNNSYGQLGNGKLEYDVKAPVQVSGLSNVKALSVGLLHASALTNDGSAWGWGTLSNQTRTTPARTNGFASGVAISAGRDFVLALKSDGTVWGWGGNSYGQLGIGTRSATVNAPVQVVNLDKVVKVSAGYVHALALRQDGSVWSWGSDNYGTLGTKAPVTYLARQVPGLPTPVGGASGVKAIVAGAYNSAVLYTDGSVWAWGQNSNGQLGNGGTSLALAPVRINSVNDIVSVSIGEGFITLVSANGTVFSIGANATGQLGNNTTSSASVPVQVVGLSGVSYLNLGKSAGK